MIHSFSNPSLSVFSKRPPTTPPCPSSVEAASFSSSCLRESKADCRSVNSMAKFGSKRGQKRTKNAPDKYGKRGASTKKARTEEPVEQSPPTSPESENMSPAASEDLEVYREPSMYDNLLSTLKSGSKSLSDAYRRRQMQEEGRSDSEEDESDASSHSDEDASDDGDVDEFSTKLGSNGMLDVPEEAEDAASESDNEDIEDESNSEASDSGEENTVEVPSVGTSSFNVHFGRNLSNEEADGLSNKKWKYGWEVPAIDMPNCKWKGTGECFIKDDDTNLASEVKPSLYQHWLNIYKTNGGNDFKSKRLFFSLCNSYRDILHCNKKPFYHKGHGEDSNIMDAYLMHSLNHVFKTGDTVKKNDSKLSKNEKSGNDELLYNDCFRDQGFTRPKILILLPLRSIGFRVIKRLLHLTPSNCKVNVEHMDRFSDEFGSDAAEDAEENDALSKQTSKPSDFRALFGGNNDDHFMIGIKFTKKSIKLFSDFHTSDIIVASPLGLITKIGEAEREKEKNVDYLTSIEILIIDHADVIAMQNWSHVDTVIQQLNKLPLTQSNTDINRIRHWYYDGHARFYRQSIILSNYLNPEMNALFNRHFVNYAGKVKLVCHYKGVLPKVLLQVRQIYERFEAKSIEDASDARLEYFSKKVFPKIKDSVQGGIMLFISSYFEFVRVRNFLKSQNASICLLGEYTRQSDISRSRIWFFEGKRKMMLYTERAHFYHRYKIRGIRNLIIYSLPERKEFYPEIVNMLDGSDNMTCTVLFSHFDQLRLERIVGSSASKRMITSEKGVFVFC